MSNKNNTNSDMLDLAIIGGGPAGLTAGLYATRGGLSNVVMYEKGMPGGQITSSSEIENYPGQLEVVTGMDLMADWPKQCSQFGLVHKMNEVKNVTQNSDKTFTLTLENGDKVQSKTVLMATGSIPKKAGFKGEDEFFGRGVSTCATCDGFFYKDKEACVLGGGDTALEEALFLANICSKVYVIHRRDKFSASPATIKRVQENDKIELITNSIVDEVVGDSAGVTNVIVQNRETKDKRDIATMGIFVFVGRDVLNETLIQEDGSFLCATNKAGEIIVDLSMKTNIDGLFAGGDIRIEAPKQVVCAAGDGATAGVNIINYIENMH
jgi:thioredoxin reductase (NADPH)